jgi:microbial collagenase
MRHRSPLPRILAVGLASAGLVVGLLASAAQAASAPVPASAAGAAHSVGHTNPHTAPPPTGASVENSDTLAAQPTARPTDRLKPQRSLARQSTAKAVSKTSGAKRATTGKAATAAQSCTPGDFSSRTGSSLVAFVKGSTTSCLSSLFSLTGSDAHGVFQESQMVTIANAFGSAAASYTGDDSGNVGELEYFLRAGYYVQYYDPTDVGTYGTALSGAIESALDTFFASPHLLDVTDANGAIVGDVVILTDSANEQNRYLSVYKEILNSYTSAWDSSYYMDGVVYDVYTPLWRGQWNDAFVSAVTSDPSVFDTLYNFATSHTSMLGGDNTFMDSDAGNDLATYVQFPALQSKLRPMISGLLNVSSISGPTAALWVAVASQASYNDPSNCSYYGVCDLKARLVATALPTTYSCDSVRTIQAQALSSTDLAAVCASLQNQDPFFHNLVKDKGPIPNQYESTYRLIVFASQLDYQVYGAAIYSIDTNNGGITLTGDPTQAGNQPESIMYQWPDDNGFVARIWNLNHEYTHILDARYDTKGDFNAETVVPDVWWIEGLAEYVSYTYRGVTDTGALDVASQHTYALSTLFQNTYSNSDTTRIYYWGYLAVRYMFEKHPNDVYAMLSHFRTGDYTGGYAVYNSIGTAYDADFDSWLNTLAASAGTPTAAFTSTVTGLTATFADASTESGTGSITGWNWNFGDGSSSTSQNPTHTYAAAGNYTVTLTVTDSNGNTSSANQTVTVSTTLPTCTASDTRAMGQNCQRSGRSMSTGNYDYMYIYMPAGSTTLTITTSGGTGNADLYYSPNSWATTSTYTAKSTNSGNTESITVSNTAAGYRYISLYAVSGFSGVTVTTRY